METLTIIGAILMVLGIIGSIVPAMPGPILSFIGILLLYFAKGAQVVPVSILLVFGIIVLFLAAVDYIGPILGAKFFGASKKGIWGAAIGAVIGFFLFPPLGILIGAMAGAYIGEIQGGKLSPEAFRAATGVIFGSVFVIILQVLFSLFSAGYFFYKLF